MGSPEDYQQALDRIAKHLSSDDVKAVAAATVTIALMCQGSHGLPADLGGVVEGLVGVLDSPELAVQRNATAALSACLESSDTAVQAAIENRVAERAVQLLEGGVEDGGLQLNLVVLLGTLGEASETTAQLVLDAGGVPQLVSRADPALSLQLQEAAVDGLCKLAANFAPAKDAAAAAGAIPRLAALLGNRSSSRSGQSGSSSSSSSSSMEVRVRALLCLGMLIGDHPQRQLELAAVPGAVSAVLSLMRQQDDGDCQQIAVGLFKELASNAEAKDAIAQALKQQQEADAGAAKFV